MDGRTYCSKEGRFDFPLDAWPRGYDVDSGTHHGVIWSTEYRVRSMYSTYKKYFIMHKSCFELRDTHAFDCGVLHSGLSATYVRFKPPDGGVHGSHSVPEEYLTSPFPVYLFPATRYCFVCILRSTTFGLYVICKIRLS